MTLQYDRLKLRQPSKEKFVEGNLLNMSKNTLGVTGLEV